jgi:hypothetical protein
MLTREELRKVYQEEFHLCLVNVKPCDPTGEALLAVARYVEKRVREQEPTREMLEAGAIAASKDGDFRVDPVIAYEDCDNVFRAEWRGKVEEAFRAMQRAAPSVVFPAPEKF